MIGSLLSYVNVLAGDSLRSSEKSVAPLSLTATSETSALATRTRRVEVESLPIVQVIRVLHDPTANNAASAAMASRKEDEEAIVGDLARASSWKE